MLGYGRRTAPDRTGKLARHASQLRNNDQPNTTECKKKNENGSDLKRFQFLENALQMNGRFARCRGMLRAGPQRGETQNVVARRYAGEQKTDRKQDRGNSLDPAAAAAHTPTLSLGQRKKRDSHKRDQSPSYVQGNR